MKDRGVMQVGV